jgi:CheY-like chemotaxis protein
MRKRILLADDDRSIRESFGKLLSQRGYEVLLAGNGEEALAQLQSERIDLLLLDLQMPGMDGWDVLQRLGAPFCSLPVILVTGLADQLDSKKIPGLSALLEKPVEGELLLETVASALHDAVGSCDGGHSSSDLVSIGVPGYLKLPK